MNASILSGLNCCTLTSWQYLKHRSHRWQKSDLMKSHSYRFLKQKTRFLTEHILARWITYIIAHVVSRLARKHTRSLIGKSIDNFLWSRWHIISAQHCRFNRFFLFYRYRGPNNTVLKPTPCIKKAANHLISISSY